MTHKSLSPEDVWGPSSARPPVHAKQGNMLLLIVLDACARLSFACWHFLSLTFPVQVPCCSWMLFVALCVYLWFSHPQKNVTPLSFLSFGFLLSLHFFPWPCSLSFRLLQLCPGTVSLEMPEACIFPLQSDSDVPDLLSTLFVCSPELCWLWFVRVKRDICLAKQCHCSLLLFKI